MDIRVYLTRDGDSNDAEVEVYTRKPLCGDTGVYYGEGPDTPLADFCYEEFLKITGFKIKPGECKRVRIEIKEV